MSSSFGIAAALALTVGVNAETWETIYQVPDGVGEAIITDPDTTIPGLFVGGHSGFGSVLHLDQSTAPVTANVSDATPDFVLDLRTDSSGNLYSAGHFNRSVVNWQVRKSQNGGVTWQVLDDGSTWSPRDNTVARGVAADANRYVFASGRQTKKNGHFWVIRRGVNGGSSWNTVFQAKENSEGGELVVVPPAPGKHAGGIFAAGRVLSGGVYRWTVLRSQNGGISWVAIDSWSPGKNISAAATIITSDPQGNLFVGGIDRPGAAATAWWVRRSGDGGATWQTILADYKATTLAPDEPFGLSADLDGNLYVVGKTHALGTTTWTVRRWNAASALWDTWDDSLRYPLWGSAVAKGVATDAVGNVYVTGIAGGEWIVQRLLAN